MVVHKTVQSPMKPILIIGAPGSGTTLLYQTVCSHRDLAYTTPNMLRAGILRHGRLLGDRRKALFILQNLIHHDYTSNLPQGDALWIKHFGDYNYMTENNYSEEIAHIIERKYWQCRIFGVVHGLWTRLY